MSQSQHSEPIDTLTNELGKTSMYAGIYTTASRTAFAKAPANSIRSGAAENTSKTLTSTGKFEMGVETGSGTDINRLLAAAFYRRNLTSDELENSVYARFAEFKTAVNTGTAL
ncbi:hypothetical protein ASG42_25240 [Rhizobium sp. Leaf391]|nr:hypothetical protein ASG42_25240 [Rhizobium sp. Leaf391]